MNSFFDDETTKTKFEFIKPKMKHEKDLFSSLLIKNNLLCLTPGSKTPKQGIYAIHNQILVQYPGERSKPQNTILEIGFATLKTVPPTKKIPHHGFRLTRNGTSFDFYSPEKQIIDGWMRTLRKICVCGSFHEDFKMIQSLGKGGFAKVYMAESKASKNLYAVKAFNKKANSSEKDKSKPALLLEISLMKSLNHENIVKLHEVHETENTIYLVMELIKGRTLDDALKRQAQKRRTFSENRIRDMVQIMLNVLAYFGSQGVVHRDLKPANILLDTEGKIKIADFGLATEIKSLNPLFKKCGTLGYMAPEVLLEEEKARFLTYDDRCDVFSIGCVLFFMLFGFPLFKGYKGTQLIFANKDFDLNFENLDYVRTELSNPQSRYDKEGLNLLLKLLEPNPANRPTAKEALEHPYFLSALIPRKNLSLDTTLSSPQKIIYSGLLTPPRKQRQGNFPFSDESLDSGSYIGPGQHRFVEKESLVLDVGNGDSTGKIEVGSYCSVQSPLTPFMHFLHDDNRGPGSEVSSLLNTDKPKTPVSQNLSQNLSHNQSQYFSSKSPKSPNFGDFHLKTTMITTMHRGENVTESETKVTGIESSFFHSHTFRFSRFSLVKEVNKEPEISEVDNLGDEDLSVRDQIENMKKVLTEMIPNLASHRRSRSRLISPERQSQLVPFN